MKCEEIYMKLILVETKNHNTESTPTTNLAVTNEASSLLANTDISTAEVLLLHRSRGSIAFRTSVSQLREPGFESSCCHFEALAIFFIPCCHSSLSCKIEYLATDKDGYWNK